MTDDEKCGSRAKGSLTCIASVGGVFLHTYFIPINYLPRRALYIFCKSNFYFHLLVSCIFSQLLSLNDSSSLTNEKDHHYFLNSADVCW